MASKIGFFLVYTLVVLIINSNVDATQPAYGGAAQAGGGAAPAGGGAAHAGGGTAPTGDGAAPAAGGTVFDITKLGATPNGDATKGILAAWEKACKATSPSQIIIPPGEYTLGPVVLSGPCKSKITICVKGNFKAISADKFGKKDDGLFKIKKVSGVTIQAGAGGGIFDGQGPKEWAKNDCAHNKDCKMMPYNFRFDHINDSSIIGITSKDSKSFHMNLCRCNRINLHQVTISAPGDSPNTDGIHLSRSEGINITDCKIGTGDDCISMCDNIRNVFIEGVKCGPGHGISIGSVGGSPTETPLTCIHVKNCSFIGTDNGVRIKSWLDSYENTVSGVIFEDITVENVKNPIVIDQEYCPYNHCKSKAPSKVKISDVKIKNVKGTSCTPAVVTLSCSTTKPCDKVEISDVDLKYVGTEKGTEKGKGKGKGKGMEKGKENEGGAKFVCKGVKPITTGVVNPPPCTSDVTQLDSDL